MDPENPIVAKHLKLAKRLMQLWFWREHLHDQMLLYKLDPSKPKRRKNPFTPLDYTICKVQLFLKLPRMSSFHTYPSYFQCYLEDVMWNEVGPDVMDQWPIHEKFLYYHTMKRWTKDEQLVGCPQLDTTVSKLTAHDVEILKDFNRTCLELVDEVIPLISFRKRETLTLKAYRRRLLSCINDQRCYVPQVFQTDDNEMNEAR